MLQFIASSDNDPQPFERIDAAGDSSILLVCDHASAIIPARYGTLGLDDATRGAHVAWDIGAAMVTRMLAAHLDCTALLAGISRLVIDCNRQPGDPSSIPARTCGTEVPGNRKIDDAEAEARAAAWFWPYHQEIGTTLARMFRRGPVPVMISLHSFTPRMGDFPRPWQVGVLWNRDGRMALPVIDALRGDPGLNVGDNQPYSGREINYTLDTHAGAAGLPHLSFEIRQDLLADEAGCRRWAALLAQVLKPVLADGQLRRVQVF
jgi:predicted N-formylglutamate amidohydrolase